MGIKSELYEVLLDRHLEEMEKLIALLSHLTYIEKVELMGIMIGLKMQPKKI